MRLLENMPFFRKKGGLSVFLLWRYYSIFHLKTELPFHLK